MQLFPFHDYWWFYPAFTAFVMVLLAVDLGVFHRQAHRVSIKEAAAWCAVWVAVSLIFSFCLYQYALWKLPRDARLAAVPGFDPSAAAWRMFLEFLTGYIVEYTLSVDNIFVFVVVFNYFGIPSVQQHRVLFYGILGAILLRGAFVVAGAMLIRYEWVVMAFGLFLIYTGLRMMFSAETEVEPEKNVVIRLMRRWMPVTPQLHGQRFLVPIDGRRHATPLLICLVFLSLIDTVFAVDSVPAIFAVTREPLVVFSSNILAVLGLRTLYFMLAGAMDKFHMLKYGLSVVLIFVGFKMTWLPRLFGGKFPIELSLAIIVGVIVVAVILSLVFPKREEEGDA